MFVRLVGEDGVSERSWNIFAVSFREFVALGISMGMWPHYKGYNEGMDRLKAVSLIKFN